MSNQNLPGPYWQEERGPAGRRSGSDGGSSGQSPWDDARFWRDDNRGSASGRSSGQARGGRHGGGSAGSRGAGAGRSASARSASARSALQSRFSQTADKFSHTADDLRKRFGTRGAAASGGSGSAGRADEDYWEASGSARANGHSASNGSRGGAAANGGGRAYGNGAGTSRNGARATGAQPGYRGARRAGDSRADYGDYRAGRTAVRDEPDFWTGDAGRRSLRDRVAERTGVGTGGGGRGGRGGGYGRGRWDNGRGQGFKHWLLYGSWWRRWTIKKALAVMGIGIAGFILLGFAVVAIMYEMTPIPTDVSETANFQSSTVYLANGKILGTFSDQGANRQLLSTPQIPQTMDQAMVAAEDRHFYTEGGISVTGILRSGFEDLFGSGGLQGGSTITEQYAKNYYTSVGFSRSITTKVKEIFIAIKLAHERSKSWILTQYLNTVYFGSYGGNQFDGVGAAAQGYFGVNLSAKGSTLTVAQAAMLAAMPNEPSFFTPISTGGPGFSALVARWQYVLVNMVRDNAISKQTATSLCAYCQLGGKHGAEAAFVKDVKIVAPSTTNGWSGYKGYLMEMVQQQLTAPKVDGGYQLSVNDIDTGGYQIHTTFSMAKVDELATAVNIEKQQMAALGQPYQSYDRIGAVLENNSGAIVAIYGGPGYGSKNCAKTNCDLNMAEAAEPVGSSFKPYVLSTAVTEGMSVLNSQLNGFSPIWIPNVPANQQTDDMLSPTSAPCAAAQTQFGGYCGSIHYYKFDESDENSDRPLAVNVAAAISSDPAFEDLAHRDGINAVINMAKEFGVGQNSFVEPCGASAGSNGTQAAIIADCNDLTGPGYTVGKTDVLGNGLVGSFSTDASLDSAAASQQGLPGSPAIALGENPLTPIEQATTFATLDDGGVYHSAHVISKLLQGSTLIPSPVRHWRVLNAPEAADIDWALSFDNNMSGGTADVNVPFRRGDVIGKTGTLGSGENASEAWFNGATPDQYALSIALFTNNPGTENLDNLPEIGGTPGSQGGGWPATIWNYFMSTYMNNMPYNALAAPTNTQASGAPFQTWIRAKVKAPKKQKCFGLGNNFKLCINCHGAKCTTSPNPNPNPTCPPLNPNCAGATTATATTTPAPTPSAQTSSPAPTTSTSPAATTAAEEPAEETSKVAIRSG